MHRLHTREGIDKYRSIDYNRSIEGIDYNNYVEIA